MSSFNKKDPQTPNTAPILSKPSTVTIRNQPHPVQSTITTITVGKKPPTKDRRAKVDGRECRIRIPATSIALVSRLTHALSHKRHSQTIEWLLREAEPAIINVLGRGSSMVTEQRVVTVRAPVAPHLALPLAPIPPEPPVQTVPVVHYESSMVEADGHQYSYPFEPVDNHYVPFTTLINQTGILAQEKFSMYNCGFNALSDEDLKDFDC